MKYAIFFMCALCTASVVTSALEAGKKRTHKTAVVDCAGEGTKCSAVVNAIGDVITFDVSKQTPKSLGKISQEKAIDIDFPQQPDTKTLYSFVPTTGESQGKTIHVLFDNAKQRAGSRHFGKTVINIYRQFLGEKPTQWTEVGELVTPEKALEKESVTFKPDGTASWTRPETGEIFVFALGRKNLK